MFKFLKRKRFKCGWVAKGYDKVHWVTEVCTVLEAMQFAVFSEYKPAIYDKSTGYNIKGSKKISDYLRIELEKNHRRKENVES